MNAIIWLVIFVLLVIFELFTMGLTTIWFAVGALVSFISALCGAEMVLQFVLFIMVSFAMLIITRPIAVKYINKKTVKTNVESMEGAIGRVIATIDNDQASGYVVIEGQEWAARSSDGCVIPVDTMVKVESVEGVKVIVSVKSNETVSDVEEEKINK